MRSAGAGLGLTPQQVAVTLAGHPPLAGAPGGPTAPAIEHDPHIAHLMMRRFDDLTPLDPATAELVRPWRPLIRRAMARERPDRRRRREADRAARADLVRHVPRADAPLDPRTPGNAFGRTTSHPSRARGPMPFRVCLALWSMGFGAVLITRLAAEAGVPTSVSAITRMLKQARHRFDGAVAVRCRDLATELDIRPLPIIPR